MAYRVDTRLSYGGTRMRGVFGDEATYQRGSSTCTVTVTPGHTDLQALHAEQMVSVVRYVDFIITAAEIVLSGGIGLTEPEPGDVITWQGVTYVVTPPANLDECFNYTTMLRHRLRIHTLKQ